MKRKLKRFLKQRHLKITDVVLIVILGLMMSIQVIRWSGREIRQSQAAIPQSEQVKLNFIQKVAPIAESEQRQSHVLASITIAQAALESDWGQSELSQKYNNLFGVKGTGTNSAMMTTKEYVNGQWVTVKASFAVYPSWAASIAAHTKLLVDGLEGDQNHYEQVVNATNYETAAEALQANGYATDPNYAQKLIAIIQKYKLYQYDNG